MPSFWMLGAASFVAALGLTSLVAGLAADPLQRERTPRLERAASLIGLLAATASAGLALLGHPLGAMAAGGVALGAAGAWIALLRARPAGEDDGGGSSTDDPAPDPPGLPGDSVWEEFERAFRAYAERETVVR